MEQFDELLKEALTEYEREENGLGIEPETIPAFSPEFEARLDKLLSGKIVYGRRKKMKKLQKALAAAAVFFLVISLFRPAQGVYAGMADSVVQVYEQFRRITNDDKDVSSYEMMPEPTYVPEGYVKDDGACVEINGIRKLVYTNVEEGGVTIEYMSKEIALALQTDEEKHDYEEVKIAGLYAGMYYEAAQKNGSNILDWNNGTIWYSVWGSIPKEELLKIAESIMNQGVF